MIMKQDHEDEYSIYREDCAEFYHSDFDVDRFPIEDLKAARKKIVEASMTNQDCYEWTMGVEEGDLNAMIALILTLTPNLQVLDIDMWTRPDSVPPILTRMLAQAGQLQRERQLGHPFALWGLKKVVVRYHHASDMYDIIHHLTSLLTIPSVEILCAIHEDASDNDYDDFPKADVYENELEAALQGNNLGLANMKELSLSFIPIHPNALLRLWCCYPNLKKFSYRDRLTDDGNDSSKLDQVKDINLMAKASHLQKLTILSGGYIWSSIMTSSTSSLAPFKCLRRVETTWPIFTCCGHMDRGTGDLPSSQSIVDAIPSSFEQLCILGGPYRRKVYHDLALDVIFKLIQQKRHLLALKILDFGWKQGRHADISIPEHILYHKGFTEDYLQVIDWCQGSGLELILEPVEPPHPKYIIYCVDDDGNRAASGTNEVKHIVHYPYHDYERICNENGCNLKTGRPHTGEEDDSEIEVPPTLQRLFGNLIRSVEDMHRGW